MRRAAAANNVMANQVAQNQNFQGVAFAQTTASYPVVQATVVPNALPNALPNMPKAADCGPGYLHATADTSGPVNPTAPLPPSYNSCTKLQFGGDPWLATTGTRQDAEEHLRSIGIAGMRLCDKLLF